MELNGLSKLTKADIVDGLYNKVSADRNKIKEIVDLFLEELKAALVSGKVIELRGFGTFEVKVRKGREKARNPKTGEFLTVPSHMIVAFRAGRDLRRDVWPIKNGGQIT